MMGSTEQHLLMYSKNTFCLGVCNDGGSHVETSLICVVPLLWALYRLVVSSITWGSQVQQRVAPYCFAVFLNMLKIRTNGINLIVSRHLVLLLNFCGSYCIFQGGIQDLIRGGPDHDRPKLPMVHSSIVQAK